MAQVKVTVQGNGTFEVDVTKIGELLGWLSRNQAVDVTESNVVREVKNNDFTGRQLINE